MVVCGSARAAALVSRIVVLSLFAACGCHREDTRTKVSSVTRCERAIYEATTKQTIQEASRIYHEGCADLHAEPGCRQAFHDAAKAKPENQLSMTAEGCRKAYCPILGPSKFEICRDDFKATPASLLRAWPPFQSAVLKHDTGPMHHRVTNALLRQYLHIKSLERAEPSKKTPADAGASSASGEGGAPLPAASGSAPAASGSSAASASSASLGPKGRAAASAPPAPSRTPPK